MGWCDMSPWLTVDKKRIGSSLHRFHGQANPLFRQPDLKHNLFEKVSLDSVVGLANIQLHCHMPYFSFLSVLHSMKHFVSHSSVVCDQSSRDKCTLGVWDRLYPICCYLWHHTSNHISQANGRYSVMYSGFVLFGMRTTCEWCIFRRQWPERKTKRTTEVTSGSTMDHNCWKKYEDISLGPEDLYHRLKKKKKTVYSH